MFIKLQSILLSVELSFDKHIQSSNHHHKQENKYIHHPKFLCVPL